ncbi:MAG: hypothetical protein O2U62_03780 [Candidatus Bathyarchaeota archaeon]|jgi:hypothetical protein|nr:hypothetical protein [Candidatus Bathyarchaeota archaeon]
MSFRGREQDKEFQLELLRIQLKHERAIVLYTVGMAIGASLLVFSLTVGLTVVLTEKTIPVLWVHMITAYLLAGGMLLIGSAVLFANLKYSERKDIERLKKKYSEW